MSISVRPLVENDQERWGELWQGYLIFYGTELPQETSDHTWEMLLTPEATHKGLVYVDGDDRALGFTHYLFHRSTWTTGFYCYLEDLFVAPEARGIGAGRALIKAVEEDARANGSTRLYLVTQEFNDTARGLYDKTMTLAPFVQYRTTLD